jgi:hypothetical protein
MSNLGSYKGPYVENSLSGSMRAKQKMKLEEMRREREKEEAMRGPPPSPYKGQETSRYMIGGKYLPAEAKLEHPDIHETLKQEMFRSDIKGDDNHFEKSRPGPTMYGLSDQYVVLDSALKNRTDSNPTNGVYAFNFMVQGISKYNDQVIGVNNKMENVIEIEVGKFCMQKPADNAYVTNTTNTALPTLTANGGAPAAGVLTQVPYCGKIYAEIKELGRQFYSDSDNVRHHFEFAVTDNGNGTITMTPDDEFKKFQFTDPTKDIQGMTLIFRNPFIGISFLPDVYVGAAAIVGAAQELTFSIQSHGLAANDLLFIKGFASASSVINNWVNRVQGVIVGTGGLTANQFRLNADVDVTPLGLAPGATISAGSFDVIVAKRRFLIPLRVRCMVSRLTNYKSP